MLRIGFVYEIRVEQSPWSWNLLLIVLLGHNLFCIVALRYFLCLLVRMKKTNRQTFRQTHAQVYTQTKNRQTKDRYVDVHIDKYTER